MTNVEITGGPMEANKYPTIEEWSSDYNGFDTYETLLIKRLKDKGFNEDQILDILHVLDNTCLYCFDGDKKCHCCNDE